MPFAVLTDVATSMLVYGMFAVLVVYSWRFYRDSPAARAQDGPQILWVIVGFSVWATVKTFVPMLTSVLEEGSRSWRVPLNVAANLLVVGLIYVVIRSMGARRERERRGGH